MTPRFVSERSSPGNGYYFWAYTIDIANLGTGDGAAQDAPLAHHRRHGKPQEVRGSRRQSAETPTLEPGEKSSFEYTSGVLLPTPVRLHDRDPMGMVTMGGEGF